MWASDAFQTPISYPVLISVFNPSVPHHPPPTRFVPALPQFPPLPPPLLYPALPPLSQLPPLPALSFFAPPQSPTLPLPPSLTYALSILPGESGPSRTLDPSGVDCLQSQFHWSVREHKAQGLVHWMQGALDGLQSVKRKKTIGELPSSRAAFLISWRCRLHYVVALAKREATEHVIILLMHT